MLFSSMEGTDYLKETVKILVNEQEIEMQTKITADQS